MKKLEEWLKKRLLEDEIITWFKANNIIIERLFLFKDFIGDLLQLVEETYVGYELDDAIENPLLLTNDDNKNHFNWCWKKNIQNFNKEGINFSEEGEYKTLLWNLINDLFYNKVGKTKPDLGYLVKIFEVSYPYTKSDIDILTEMYKKIEKAFIFSN